MSARPNSIPYNCCFWKWTQKTRQNDVNKNRVSTYPFPFTNFIQIFAVEFQRYVFSAWSVYVWKHSRALVLPTRSHQSIPFLESKVGRRRGAVHTRTSLSSFSFGLCQELCSVYPRDRGFDPMLFPMSFKWIPWRTETPRPSSRGPNS